MLVEVKMLTRQFCFSPELQNVCESLEGCHSLREVHLTGNPLQQESGWRYAGSTSCCDLLSRTGRDSGIVLVCSGYWRLSQRRKISIHTVETLWRKVVFLKSVSCCVERRIKSHYTSIISHQQFHSCSQTHIFLCAVQDQQFDPHLLLDYRDKPQTFCSFILII